MAAGFFSKTLSTLLSSAARWVEFPDGVTAPVHGAVLLDATTGLADASVKLRDQNGALLQWPASAPVSPSDSSGNLADGVVVTGTGANNGDIVFDLPTAAARAVVFDIISGSGWAMLIEGTLDGVNWKILPVAVLTSNVTPPTWFGIVVNASRFGAPTTGAIRVRARINGVGTGTLSVVARAIGANLPEAFLALRDKVYRTTTGAAARAANLAKLLTGVTLQNTASSARFLQIYDNGSTPTVGTDTPVHTIPLSANEIFRQSGLRIAVSNGLGLATTTDFAGTTAASSGDVVGSLLYSD